MSQWYFLAAEGAMTHFLMEDDVHAVRNQEGSVAKALRAYFLTQRSKIVTKGSYFISGTVFIELLRTFEN